SSLAEERAAKKKSKSQARRRRSRLRMSREQRERATGSRACIAQWLPANACSRRVFARSRSKCAGLRAETRLPQHSLRLHYGVATSYSVCELERSEVTPKHVNHIATATS